VSPLSLWVTPRRRENHLISTTGPISYVFSGQILAIFTTGTTSGAEVIAARYAHRWPIEVAIAGGKQLPGIGQARNRLQLAVERTVPLGFASTVSSSSGTPCTATIKTTSKAFASNSLGTRSRTSLLSKVCS
jgi:hypothetical protein